MKKLTALLLLISFASNTALACDFSTGIKSNPDGSYTYSKACHIQVGQMKQDLEVAHKQIEKLDQALQLKDLALVKSDERVKLWMDTSYRMEERLTKIEQMRSKNEIWYFVGGVVLTGLAVWGAGQLR